MTYAACMAQLLRGERRALISRYIDKAKINWAHIAIAQLMKCGFVDRVLTTNFDLLVVRACALVNVFPAVYDFGTSQRFNPTDVFDLSVFNLHGQRTGFVMLNTDDELRSHGELVAPIFSDQVGGRVWIVVGYSGENDPVFKQLAKVERFDNGLYWIGYKDAQPAKHVEEGLFAGDKDAFYVKGYDADTFFVSMAQQLNCFPPELIVKPFTHLKNVLGTLTEYPLQDTERDVTAEARVWIGQAIEKYEKQKVSAS